MARAAAARATTAPAPRRAPQRTTPRRKPAPARRRSTGRTAPTRTVRARPAGKRAKAAKRLSAIPHSPFVDRLLTGRAWIVLVAVLLAGIVFANVALLEKNAGIARTTEKVATLKRENSRLRLEAARLGSSERIQRAAADLGLVLPAPGEVRYLEARPEEDPALALKRMSEPEPVPVYTPPVEPAPELVTTPTTEAPVATESAPVTTPTEPAPVEPTAPTATTTPPATTGQTG